MSCDILIIEDQEKIARLVQDYLLTEGLQCQWRRNGDSLETDLEKLNPRLVILDRMLPGREGLTLCQIIRDTSSAAVIMLTARIEEDERLAGFSSGADDYVCKPFSPRELVARVQAVLQRVAPLNARRWQSGALCFNDETLCVSSQHGELALTALRYRLLATMARRANRVFSREDLINACHDDGRELNDRTIDSHIRTLRKQLLTVAPSEPPIETVYGAGYRFSNRVKKNH
jgi:two-component system response regulator BaeR